MSALLTRISKRFVIVLPAVVLLAGLLNEPAFAQRARFEDPFRANTLGLAPPNALQGGFQQPSITPPRIFGQGAIPSSNPSIITAPQIRGQQFGAPNFVQPPALQLPTLQAPAFDPFNPNSNPLPRRPFNSAPPINVLPPVVNQPPQNLPQLGVPQFQPPGPNIGFQPPAGPGFQPIGQPGFSQPYGTYQLRNQWPYNSPGENWWPSLEWPSQVWARLRSDVLPRVLERPRFRHTWLQGNNGNELDINDIELATTATIPNFLNGNQPLRISPNFAFHYWNGPDTAITGFDLPARAYSAYLSTDYVSDPRQRGGIETNLSLGVYSDFHNVSSDSLRLTGSAVGWRRVNSYSTAKLGVEYFDRIKVKLLPAFGVFMAPNPDLKIDLYFPRPKIAHRLPGVQGLEAWGYAGAEYGGGSWTIERLGGMDDQVDINDVRAFVGVEWLGPQRVTGFVEAGYVFERELLYRSDPTSELDLQDTFMIRSGLAF